MSKNKLSILIVFITLVSSALACNFSASTANIKNAYMARDQEGKERTTSYEPGQVFYAIVNLSNAPSDTTLKAAWIAVDAQGVEPNKPLKESEITTDSGQVYFSLNSDQPWAPGKYKVDISLNGKPANTLEFQVQGAALISPTVAAPTQSSPTLPPATPVSQTGAARISGAFMARDKDGNQPTTSFATGEVFYAIVDLVDAPDNTNLKSVWTAVQAEGVAPNKLIDQVEITTGTGRLYFYLTPSKPWPAGKYKVDLYVNGSLAQTLEFDVPASSAPVSGNAALVKRIFLAQDKAGNQPTQVFSPNQVIYCHVELQNAPAGTQTRAVWFVVQAQNAQPGSKIDEVTFDQPGDSIIFNLSPTKPWPIGTYKVEIYINDELVQTLDYSVQ
jgi:hypothetical protein